MTDKDAVVVNGLVKRYGNLPAVRGASFTVADNEIFALLGPNGAGKTTILEILEGFRGRDGGRVCVLGLDPGARSTARQLRERIGLVLQDIAVEPYLTVRETVARNAGYYPAPRSVDETIELVGLAGQEHRKVKDLSRWAKAPARPGSGGDRQSPFVVSGRADHRLRPLGPAERLAGCARPAGRGHHHRADHPLYGGSPELADRVAVIAAGIIVAEGDPATIGGRDRARARIQFTLPAGAQPDDLPVTPTAQEGGLITIEVDDPTATLYALTGWARQRIPAWRIWPCYGPAWRRSICSSPKPTSRPFVGRRIRSGPAPPDSG